MTLDTYFQISVSVFSTLATLFLLGMIVWAFILRAQIARLIKKLLEISDIAKETAGNTRDFVDKTIDSLEEFKQSIFTFEFARRIVTEVIDLIKNNSTTRRQKRSR